MTVRPKKKNYLLSSEHLGEIFFSNDVAGKFFLEQVN